MSKQYNRDILSLAESQFQGHGLALAPGEWGGREEKGREGIEVIFFL